MIDRISEAKKQPVCCPGRNTAALRPAAVARDEELFLLPVPDGKGEHATEVPKTIGAPFGVGGDQYFGVARSMKGVIINPNAVLTSW